MAAVDRKQEPFVPKKRPKPTQEIKLKKGKSSKQRYIKNSKKFYYFEDNNLIMGKKYNLKTKRF